MAISGRPCNAHACDTTLTMAVRSDRRLIQVALHVGKGLAHVRVANKQALRQATAGLEGVHATWPSD